MSHMTTSPWPSSTVSDPIIEAMALAMALSDGISLEDTDMVDDYRRLARVAFEATVDGAHSVKQKYGLQHTNGYTYECKDLQEAKDYKSGARIQGRRGDWKDHTIVVRSMAAIGSSWTPVTQ